MKHRPMEITVTEEGVTILRFSRSRRHDVTYKVTMGNTDAREADGEGKTVGRRCCHGLGS